LTPHLETKTGPKYFSWYPFLWTKHAQKGFWVSDIHFRHLDIHTRPSGPYQHPKLFEILGIVMPDIAEISGRTMREEGQSGGFFLVQWFVVFHRAKNWDKPDGKVELRPESRC
jgi:hypothetical protein